jgi:2-C-methyl-D-erythritol 4-phosphate cytidylyltransferase
MSVPEKVTAIVVAGDKGKSHPVLGRNKAFLEVGGLPIVVRVILALQEAKSVSEIYVVGPKQRLEETFSAIDVVKKPTHVYEQGFTLYENVWNTFLQTLPSYREGRSLGDIARGPEAETVVLVIASDMPLLTPAEIDEFVSKCDMGAFDYVVGVTAEEDLKYYYPRDGRKGIHLAYMHFKEGNFRQNNMHMVRPLKIHNRHYIQTMYDLRYQKEFGNIFRLTWEILKREEGSWKALGYYFLLQLSLLFARLRLGFLRDAVRRVTHTDSVIRCISDLLKTRTGYAFTSLGGSALDVDKEREYEAIKARFSEWMRYQQEKTRMLLTRAQFNSAVEAAESEEG